MYNSNWWYDSEENSDGQGFRTANMHNFEVTFKVAQSKKIKKSPGENVARVAPKFERHFPRATFSSVKINFVYSNNKETALLCDNDPNNLRGFIYSTS